MEPQEISAKTGIGLMRVAGLTVTGRKKLLEERTRRKAPLVDRTFYTSVNGMFASSYLHAFRVLGHEAIRHFALKSIERILQDNVAGDELLHCEGVKAVLDDYVHIIGALLSAYEVTGGSFYLERAGNLMELCIRKFWDRDSGGFFDTETVVLGAKNKTIEDIPHPSANALGIMQLLKLYHMTGKDAYDKYAETALRAFSGRVQDMGIHAGYYFCSLDAYYHMLRLSLEVSPESELAVTAISLLNPYESLIYGEDKGLVTPCLNGVCLEPLSRAEVLRGFLRNPR